MTYEVLTEDSVEVMTEEEKAIALAALKEKAIAGGWSFEIKYGEFISERGDLWLAKIGVRGHVPLFIGIDDKSELRAVMKAFQSAMEAIAK